MSYEYEEHDSGGWFRWSPPESLIASIWAYQHYRDKPGILAVVFRKVARLKHRFWSIVTASDINPGATLGKGIRLPHPTGVVIHRGTVIGPGCMIMQQVTIGQTADPRAPIIGANVYVGAGAKILGPVIIGDGARIGANAVVLNSLPPHCTAVGVPARVVRSRMPSQQ
jgi:serine O-acetyltransferase